MAGEAALGVVDGSVRHCHPFPFFPVAPEAELVSLPGAEDGIFRGMGMMAGRAHPLFERIVNDVSARLQLGFIMTLKAQRASLFHGSKRVRGPRGIVACVATSFLYRIMDAGLQEPGLGRRMGIVAALAGGLFHRVVFMRILEGGFPWIVTGRAQGKGGFDQQVVLIGTVGEVARLAPPLLHGRMKNFLLVCFFLVAEITDRRPFRFQQVTPLGGMWVMAGGAPSPLESGVDLGLVRADLFTGMAGKAEVVALLLQEIFRDDPVTKVAIFALPLLDYRVDVLHGKIFLGKLLVAIETTFPLEFSLRPRYVGSKEKDSGQEKDDQTRKAHRPFEGHIPHTRS